MKSIRAASVVLGSLLILPALAADKNDKPRATLEAIRTELKPLRQRANLEPDVVAARQALDHAYRTYWETVRVAMVRLEPEKKKLIAKEIALRKQLSSVRGEASTTPTPESKSKPVQPAEKSAD